MTDFDYAINLKTKIDHGSASSEARAWASHFGSSMTDAFSQITNNAAAVFLGNALTAGFHKAMEGIKEGVVGINAEMQKLEIGIATTFNVQTGKPFEDMLGKSKEFVAQMRKDAAALPGEFSELVGIFRSAVSSGMDAGLSAEQIRRLSSNAMVAGKTLGLESDQVGRELSQLFQGRAGGHNVFGRGLGIDTSTMVGGKHFNEADASKRADFIEQKMAKFAPAIAYYEKTWDAAYSTMMDKAKQLLQDTTAPVFDYLVGKLDEFNQYVDQHGAELTKMASEWGAWITDTFDAAREIFSEWWPVLKEFFTNAYDYARELFRDISEYFEDMGTSIGEVVKDLLRDPATLDKIAMIMKYIVMAKAGGAIFGGEGGDALFGDLGDESKGLGGIMNKTGDDTGFLGTMAKEAGGGLGAVAKGGFAGVAALAALAAAAYNAVAGLNEVANAKGEGRKHASQMMGEFDEMKVSDEREWNAVQQTLKEAVAISKLGMDTSDPLSIGSAKLSGLKSELARTGEGAKKWALEKAIDHLESGYAPESLEALSRHVGIGHKEWTRKQDLAGDKRWGELEGGEAAAAGFGWDGADMSGSMGKFYKQKYLSDDIRKAAKDLAKHAKKGGGNQIINKIEMTVSSNQAPGQIARAVLDEVAKLRRRPVASPGVPGYGMT